MPPRSPEYRVVNTFSRTPSPAQICSYTVIVLESLIFYLMVRPKIISHSASLALTIVFSGSLGLLIITSFVCSYIDPSDSAMVKCKTGRRSEIQIKPEQLLYCEYCCTSVTVNAKHCRQCDRCVEDFDHHCMWINNCVGSKNYRPFIIMITSTCVNLSSYLASVVYLSVENQWSAFLGFIITSWVVMVIVFVLWFLLFNLNLLHFYLMCKGYTTYQFIVARKEEERLRQFEETQRLKKQKEEKMKKLVQKSKKKIFQLESIEVNRNDESKQTNKKTPSKSKSRLSQQQLAESQQNTNAKINIEFKSKENRSKEEVNLETTGSKILKQVTVPINTQSNIENVFIDENKNSDAQSIQLDQNELKQDGLFKPEQIRPVNERFETQSESESIRISQFFIRNKSFNYILNNEAAERPHKMLNNLSLDAEVRNREKGKDKNQDRQMMEKNKSKSSSQEMMRSDAKKSEVKRKSKGNYNRN